MRRSGRQQFLRGLTAGALGSFIGAAAVLYVLARLHLVSFPNAQATDPGRWLQWVQANLGSSIPVFAVLIVAYWVSLARLRSRLDAERPIDEIVQLDHLSDIWTTLCFGTGVIWTAIGMRGALLHALGDPGSVVPGGAFGVLQRMVDGGILLALSTTIFGGTVGYLMRVHKSVTLGPRLQQRYDQAARADSSSMRATLERIENRLKPEREGDQAPTAPNAPAHREA
jgi:hypothetical protein